MHLLLYIGRKIKSSIFFVHSSIIQHLFKFEYSAESQHWKHLAEGFFCVISFHFKMLHQYDMM